MEGLEPPDETRIYLDLQVLDRSLAGALNDLLSTENVRVCAIKRPTHERLSISSGPHLVYDAYPVVASFVTQHAELLRRLRTTFTPQQLDLWMTVEIRHKPNRELPALGFDPSILRLLADVDCLLDIDIMEFL
ncbi:MAG: hypothetical protein HYX34_14525 [Actinobacteria bacterium]|nr:hypothetical protein [Actinomycetota bacterium]